MRETFNNFTAGWLGGAAGLVIGHPFDTVKVRLQTLHYSSLLSLLVSTVKNETVLGFYKGMGFPFITVGFINSLYFAGYGASLRYLHVAKDARPTYSQIAIASVFGGVVQWIPSCPIEIVKIKLQVQQENIGHLWEKRHYHPAKRELFAGPFNCLHRVFNDLGVRRGLYKGGHVMIWRDCIGFLSYLPVYEFLMRTTEALLERKSFDTDHKYRVPVTMFAGGVAGIVSWVSIIPWDVVKSRLQADDHQHPKYKSAWHCAQLSYQSEGWRVFFRGIGVMALRAFPVNAGVFLVYEYTLELLKFCQT